MKLFRELLLDPDAGSLTAAIDVLLEAGLTLRQVSEDEKRAEMAREEPKLEMTSFETSRLKPGEVQGLFRLGDATVVQWTVFHGRAQQASEDDYGRWVTRDIKRYGIDIEGYFHGVPWYYRVGESQNTPATARWYDTSKEAVARAIEDAWFAVHVMKRYREESPPAVVGRLEAGALGQYDEETLNNFMIYDIPSEVVQ
ncbi:MAG: hypothetical protein E4H03_09870 [Myxococcales bacterium]|nr:MAG: hypothetical protein E4H03_09870 [Myxococcales bacterium]